ncbi:MAG: hypothetical protein EXR99_03540 [Gemmataceae bacterium]|nr:hypothetical protein [Gemmataceae bacterium]
MPALKIGFTADLHQPITPAWMVEEIANQAADWGPEVFIIGGDLGESLQDFQRCLALFRKKIPCPILVIPGNHDLWVRRFSDSKKLWFEELPETVSQEGCHWLEGNSFQVKGVGFAGTIAWYDYSAAGPTVSCSHLEFAQKKFDCNSDALLVDWEWSDPEFAHKVSSAFLGKLDKLEKDKEVSQVIVVTHFPILPCQIHQDTEIMGWDFSNAYAGNLTLGKEVEKYSKVSHVLSGHTHIPKKQTWPRAVGKPIETQVIGADYHKPTWIGLALE